MAKAFELVKDGIRCNYDDLDRLASRVFKVSYTEAVVQIPGTKMCWFEWTMHMLDKYHVDAIHTDLLDLYHTIGQVEAPYDKYAAFLLVLAGRDITAHAYDTNDQIVCSYKDQYYNRMVLVRSIPNGKLLLLQDNESYGDKMIFDKPNFTYSRAPFNKPFLPC